MSLRLRIALFCCLGLLSVCAGAQSITDGVLINADSMDRDMEKGLVRLKGNVQVVFQGQHLSCDRADIDTKTQTLRAEGHVILNNARVYVEGERVVFNYKQNTGYIYNGFVQSGQVVFEGDIVEKVGESRYMATNADYTACDTCPAGWSFSGRVIDAEIGGYARIKRPVFKIAGWPILILPSLIVPLKSARQSGFLVPTMDYSGKGGVAFGESYFWAINRSSDMTLTAKRYSLRGNKLRDEYRYVLGENSKGHLNSAWIPDRGFRSELGLDHTFDRWMVEYSHHLEMPENYIHRMDIHAVSDLRYTRDFPDELLGHGDPALENRASITKLSDSTYASAEMDMYTNLLKAYPLAPNDDAVNRLPELRYGLKETQLFDHGPYFSFDLDFVNFAREHYNYDDLLVTDAKTGKKRPDVDGQGNIKRDGTFDPNVDINRTGERLDLRPTLSYPFQVWHKFDILPSLTYRETQYRFFVDDPTGQFAPTAARRYIQEDIRAKTEFSRVFSSSTEPNGTRWKHSIEPEIGYSDIPWMRRPNHKFFGDFNHLQYSRQYEPAITDTDITDPNTKLQFDYEDRTIERRVVDFGLSNRLTRKTWLNGNPDYQTVALFKIWRSYDFTALPYPWSSLNASLDLRLKNFETSTSAEYNSYAKVLNTNSRVKVMTTPQNFLQVAYTRYTTYDSNYVRQDGETRNLGFGAGFVSTYLEAAGQVDYALTTNQIQAWQYELRLRPPGHCWVIKVDHRQVVGGDRQIHFTANFDFGGETKPTAAVQ